MKIIKLDAIGSTNSFLKDLAQNSTLENFTVVLTNNQTNGRGQVNNSWHSEPYKNLTFSLFTRLNNLLITQQSYLNFAVSLALFKVLSNLKIPNLSIKWPNDILSAKNKVCGILIETTFTGSKIKNTVIGIGLNVNQEFFPNELGHVASLKSICKKDFNLNDLLTKLTDELYIQIKRLEVGEFQTIHDEYLSNLYKKGIPSTFFLPNDKNAFVGIIKGVGANGKLQIQLEDDSLIEFSSKEVSMARV